MKKKNRIFYIVVVSILLLGGATGLLVNHLMGHTVAELLGSVEALTVYIGIGVFLVVFTVLFLLDWGTKK